MYNGFVGAGGNIPPIRPFFIRLFPVYTVRMGYLEMTGVGVFLQLEQCIFVVDDFIPAGATVVRVLDTNRLDLESNNTLGTVVYFVAMIENGESEVIVVKELQVVGRFVVELNPTMRIIENGESEMIVVKELQVVGRFVVELY